MFKLKVKQDLRWGNHLLTRFEKTTFEVQPRVEAKVQRLQIKTLAKQMLHSQFKSHSWPSFTVWNIWLDVCHGANICAKMRCMNHATISSKWCGNKGMFYPDGFSSIKSTGSHSFILLSKKLVFSFFFLKASWLLNTPCTDSIKPYFSIISVCVQAS